MNLAARRLAVAAAALLSLTAPAAAPGAAAAARQPAPSPAPPTGVVTRNGAALVVDGQPWRFGGYNLPCAEPFLLDDAQLGLYLDSIQQASGANALRVWFFQTQGGPANWAPFDRVVAAARARGMRLVVTMTDEWNGGCDGGAPGTEKTIDWFLQGYKQPDAGHPLAFRDFAVQLAARYAGEPAVAFWQLVNEAQAQSVDATGRLWCDNAAGAAALRAFADDVTSAVKAADPSHLVSLGTIGGSQCGLAGTAAYQQAHGGAVDLCEYHDYGASAAALPSGADGLAQRLADCASLPGGPKPLFVGESGIQGNVQPDGGPAPCSPWPACSPYAVTTDSLVRRGSFFSAKVRAAFGAGAAGYLVWVKSPFYTPTTDLYAIGDGDPTEGAMLAALRPGSPTVTAVRPCDRGVVVTWAPPGWTAGGMLTGYAVTASDGTTVAASGAGTSTVVTGLRNRRSYTFTVTARSTLGDGPPSPASNPAVPLRTAGACPTA